MSIAKNRSLAIVLTTPTLSSSSNNHRCESRAMPNCAPLWRRNASGEMEEGVRGAQRGEGPSGSLPAGVLSWMLTKGPYKSARGKRTKRNTFIAYENKRTATCGMGDKRCSSSGNAKGIP
eukprot:1137917-Pelagomonas_calceolata.AAC.2